MPREESVPWSTNTGIGKHCGDSNIARSHQKQFYVGVDWASQSHHVCVLQAADRLGEQVFKHTGLARWRAGSSNLHSLSQVAIEFRAEHAATQPPALQAMPDESEQSVQLVRAVFSG